MFAAAAILALLACGSYAVEGSDLEGFDEPVEAPSKGTGPTIEIIKDGVFMDTNDVVPATGRGAAHTTQRKGEEGASKAGTAAPTPARPAVNVYIEAGAAMLVVVYVIIILIGMRNNSKIGEAWAKTFASSGSILERNFSYRGPKETGIQLMKESSNVFKFYASGRRYCQGLLAELQLLARQDAISMLWNLLSPSEDQIKIEVFMHESNMPPIVLAIATPKHARAMQRDMLDIVRYTKRIHVNKDVFPAGDKLWILAEHSSIFQDLFSDPKMQQMFSFNGASATSLKYFRSMHLTSENSEGSHKQVLRFIFKLPSVNEMGALSGLMELVPLFIDVVGTYKLPTDLKKRAIDARAKQAEDDEELRRKRQEAVQQKRMEKAQEERARLLRMSPEARQKAEDKIQRQQAKKAMKNKVVRM